MIPSPSPSYLPSRRRDRSYLLASLTVLGFSLLGLVQGQQDFRPPDRGGSDQEVGSPQDDAARTSTATTSTSTSVSAGAATLSPVALTESQVTEATLAIGSPNPARFYLTAPFKNSSNPLYVTASLCSGPAVPSYDVDNSTILSELNMDFWQALTATLPTMYVSTDERNQSPGPNNSKLGEPDIESFFGGLAQSTTPSSQDDGAWISIYPPADARNVTGTWTMLISASTEIQPINYVATQGLTFADSDRTNALLATYNSSQGTSNDLTLALLPTYGPDSLQNAYYFDSSPCAIAASFNAFNSSRNPGRPSFNRSDTTRGSVTGNGTHVQWAISDLNPMTNYTAWLFDVGSLSPNSALQTTTLWSSIKFTTKRSQNCRLVYDVDFCPNVAYSIPVGSDVSTQDALTTINQTFAPNMANFSATLSTFPCGSQSFGQYSALKTCGDCSRAYRDWLCAVTMPRCTDALNVVDNSTSAAYPNPLDLDGVPTLTNTHLLPYVVNRQNNSRQPYIDAENGLDAGSYAELLPCIYTCYAVASSCPQPLMQWYCPLWDISAQSQYGTFADAGAQGLGGGQNGGAGQNGQRWGGLSEYISQDNFGNVYCNSLYVEKSLLLSDGGTKPTAANSIVLFVLASIISAMIIGL